MLCSKTAESIEDTVGQEGSDRRHPVHIEEDPHHDHQISTDQHHFMAVLPDPSHPPDEEGHDEEWDSKAEDIRGHIKHRLAWV